MDELIDRTLREIRATKAKIESDLGKGLSQNMEDYRLLVGRIRGLSEAEEILKEAYKKVSREEAEE